MKIISFIVLLLGLLNIHQVAAKNTSSGLRFPSERLERVDLFGIKSRQQMGLL
ncbi:hypothetical protein [Providencia sp. PROV236]|uniref:hypothetical protein n=1 Tax=Providencia sp. PROV236 TaxID=2936798 RepID=UPI0034E19D57